MDINMQLEIKIINEAFKQLLEEEPTFIKDMVGNIKEAFININIKDKIKENFEDSILKCIKENFNCIENEIEDIIDGYCLEEITRDAVTEYIEPQLKEIITDAIKNVKIK